MDEAGLTELERAHAPQVSLAPTVTVTVRYALLVDGRPCQILQAAYMVDLVPDGVNDQQQRVYLSAAPVFINDFAKQIIAKCTEAAEKAGEHPHAIRLTGYRSQLAR
jgi:hypothetical protein